MGPGKGAMYIQVNIGRNDHGVPMWGPKWQAFIQGAKEVIADAIGDTVPVSEYPPFMDGQDYTNWDAFQVHIGKGEWEGVEEESAHVSVYFDTTPKMVPRASMIAEQLETGLEVLAKGFHQDAIAFVVTESHLAERA